MLVPKHNERNGVMRRSEGFTLLEVTLVAALIGVLAMIAIPTYLGQQERARDSIAQETARQAGEYAQARYATNANQFPNLMSQEERDKAAAATGFTWRAWGIGDPSTGNKDVSVKVTGVGGERQDLEICVRADPGSRDFYCIVKNNSDTQPANAFCRRPSSDMGSSTCSKWG